MEWVVGFVLGGIAGFLVGLFCTYLYTVYRLRRAVADVGEFAMSKATDFATEQAKTQLPKLKKRLFQK